MPQFVGGYEQVGAASSGLRNNRFLLLWIGQTSSRFGSAVTSVAAPLVAALALHATAFELAALAAAGWLPWLLVSLPAGAWVDRGSPRSIMIACDLGCAVLWAGVPLAAVLGALTLVQLFVVAVLTGTLSVFFSMAFQVFLTSLVDRSELMRGNALLQSSESAAKLAGQGTAGVLTQLVGVTSGLLVDSATFLTSAATLWRIRVAPPPGRAPRRDGSVIRDVGDGLRFVWSDPLLRTFTMVPVLLNLALMAADGISVAFLLRVVHLVPALVGVVLTGTGAGGVLGALAATRVVRRFGSARAVIAATAATVPCALLVPLAAHGPRVVLFAAGSLGVGVAVGVYNVIVGAFRQTYCPPELLGRVTASMRVLVYGAIPVGAVIGGALGTAVGLRAALWVIMAATALPLLVILFSPVRRMRDLPAGRDAVEQPPAHAPV